MTFLRTLLLVVAVVMGAAACGASSVQVKAARTAVYRLPAKSMLDVAIQVAQQDYKINSNTIDPASNSFATEPQFYTKDGGRKSPSAGGFLQNLQQGDVQLWIEIRVRQVESDTVFVDIVPHTMETVLDSPKPRELKPDDPNLPPWIGGRVDSLAVGIYDAAKQYAVQSGAAPSAAPADPAAPAPATSPQ